MYQSFGNMSGGETGMGPVLPAPLDCETRALLHMALAPILEQACCWSDLADTLAERGYQLGFARGHLVIRQGDGAPLCTGGAIGFPLCELAERFGRPTVRADRGGSLGNLAL